MLKVEGKRITTEGGRPLFEIVSPSVRQLERHSTYAYAHPELTQLIDALAHAKGCIERGDEVRFCPEPLKWVDHEHYSTAPGGWLVVEVTTSHRTEWAAIQDGKWTGPWFNSRDEAKAKAGANWDPRQFHEVLRKGAMPLAVLDRVVRGRMA